MPLCRLGPPPRSFADDAHTCIMVRSTHGSTEYKVVAWLLRPDGKLPSDQSCRSSGCKTTQVGNRSGRHNSNPQCLEERRMTFVRRGDNYDSSDCAFAVKPRAFGAAQAALELDRSAPPSKGAVHAANAIW